MPGVSRDLQNLLDNCQVLTLCSLWKITRADGVILRFTDHESSIIFNSETYTPANGVRASARQAQEGFRSNNLEFIGAISDDAITNDDLRAGLYRNASVIEYVVNWKMPWMGAIQTSKYWIAETTYTQNGWSAQLNGLSIWLSHPIGNVYGRECRHVLGDAACGIDLTAIDATDSVTAVTDNRRIFETGLNQADGYWTFGTLTWTSGNNTGLVHEIKSFVNTDGVISLALKTPYVIQVGDDFVVTPGCNKSSATCISKFNNIVNFGGFPFIPGTDSVFQTPYAK